MYVRLEHHQPESAQREWDWFQPFAYAFCQTRGVIYEERAVRAQRADLCCQLLTAQTEFKQLVQRYSHVRRVARTAAQTRAERYTFLETDTYVHDLRIAILHLTVALHDQVLLGRTIDHQTGLLEAERCRAGHLQHVAQSLHGVEDRFQIMIAVCTLAYHAQTDVNLAVRVEYHR